MGGIAFFPYTTIELVQIAQKRCLAHGRAVNPDVPSEIYPIGQKIVVWLLFVSGVAFPDDGFLPCHFVFGLQNTAQNNKCNY